MPLSGKLEGTNGYLDFACQRMHLDTKRSE